MSGGGASHRFNSAPGSAPRPIGPWTGDNAGGNGNGGNHAPGTPGAASGGSLFSQSSNSASQSQSSKVNPNNIWNIPGVASDSSSGDHVGAGGSVRPMPSVTPASNIGQNTPSGSDSQQDSFTNIGIWEPTETKDKDPDSDPKGTRLWSAYLAQSRNAGHPEDKAMGGKFKVPSFQSVEDMNDNEKRQLLEKLINCHEGWGKITVNQDVSWDETMNTFNRSESISSDKTHSDNADSPTSLNDPSSFPLMSNTVNSSAVSLVSPTSKAGDGWGTPQPSADSMQQQSLRSGKTSSSSSSLQRMNSGQNFIGAADDGGTSAWGKQPQPQPQSGSNWTSQSLFCSLIF